VNQARRIRQLAGRHLSAQAIATRLNLRPAVVRRVLERSARRGAPRKREASATLSFVTTPDVAERIRAAAAALEVPVSGVLEDIVLDALYRLGIPAVSPRAASSTARRSSPILKAVSHAPAPDPGSSRRDRSRSKSSGLANPRGNRRVLPVTAADAPESVRKLLKSYDPKALRWSIPGHRYEIVIAVLTRGNEEATQWLWSVLSRDQVRKLVRTFRGAGCAEPARALLRRQLKLSKIDLPTRPYLGFAQGDVK
jgi:hypothetical protein